MVKIVLLPREQCTLGKHKIRGYIEKTWKIEESVVRGSYIEKLILTTIIK